MYKYFYLLRLSLTKIILNNFVPDILEIKLLGIILKVSTITDVEGRRLRE